MPSFIPCVRRKTSNNSTSSPPSPTGRAYAENSSDKIGAQLALADFYHRRLRPADEIKTLALVAIAAPVAAEKLTVPVATALLAGV